MSDDSPTCDVCGELATPGGLPGEPEIDTICPPCEDNWYREPAPADFAPAMRAPPHGGMTR